MNKLTGKIGIKYPIIQGGMGNSSNASLAAAVSNSGGLGMIGAGTMTPEKVEKMILDTKRLTTEPFGVNIAISVTPHVKDIVGLILKHKVPVVSLSAGNPVPLIPLLKEHGVSILSVVASVKHAKKAEAAGVDILVGEDNEAEGLN